MWWTLTGNFGNILPIDWTKTYARQLQLPTLNLNKANINADLLRTNVNELLNDPNVDEEELAKDLDLHSLILSSLQHEPLFTAEQVLEEIDEIMKDEQESVAANSKLVKAGNGNGSEIGSPMSTTSDIDEELVKSSQTAEAKSCGISSLLYEEKLGGLNTAQLNELFVELERMIQAHSEVLISELALRDELEFEKELKNSFISILLGIQNKRRQHHMDKKRVSGKGASDGTKYLTTVIPYNPEDGSPDLRTMQILIKSKYLAMFARLCIIH